MNIWIFNHYAIGPGASGGTRHYDLAKQLTAKGHKVTIFASSFNHQTLKEEHFENQNEIFIRKNYDGIEFVWIKTTPYQKNDFNRVLNMLSYSRRAYKIAKRLNDQPDIVIGSLVHPLAAYIGYKVSKIKKSVFYFEERDLWPQTLIDLGKVTERNPVIFVLAYIERFLYRKSKRIIVLFEKAVGYVQTKGIEGEKVLYLPNGIDLKRTESKALLPSKVDNLLERSKDKILAVYTGTHGLANNLDTILDAAKILQENSSQIQFLLVGNGPEKNRLLERKEREGISNLDFVEPLPKESIPALLTHCDIGLLPLKDSPVFKWGISPNKLFDYMGSSLPVVLLCNLKDTPVEKGNGGFVIKKNFSTELAEVLASTSKEELQILGQNARNYVEKEHNWAILSENLEKIMLEDTKI